MKQWILLYLFCFVLHFKVTSSNIPPKEQDPEPEILFWSQLDILLDLRQSSTLTTCATSKWLVKSVVKTNDLILPPALEAFDLLQNPGQQGQRAKSLIMGTMPASISLAGLKSLPLFCQCHQDGARQMSCLTLVVKKWDKLWTQWWTKAM